ncbi:MAG: hypothetical protein KDC48_15675, partial [Planctomycetes bacterium]|nr:hypothetical protein [Planctomycetota bacterium]
PSRAAGSPHPARSAEVVVMSGGLNAKFMQEKERFLDSHFIIFIKDQNLATTGKGVYEFDLSKYDREPITTGAGKKMKTVLLQPFGTRGKAASGKTKRIVGYYLPFGDNTAWHHRLVEDVDYCFTDTLNGCTFVVDSNRKTPFISHYNYVTGTGMIDQGKIDRHINNRYNSPTRTVGGAIRKDDYKTGGSLDYKVTIVGIRNGNRDWHFYYQRRQQDLVSTKKGSQLQSVALDSRVTLV